ncbi:Proteasome subunit alpha type-5 [Artemisia annua]|uniref:Proteasome subunit alpha type-5 n=1 Tax=Artemisia annua TaxID=35608 RepID=A0A2U1LB30_ARTAN|nr:Proteasome subunit alpha type-5 [Artemisia annua]
MDTFLNVRTEYDRGANTFSLEGRLFQVEYAIEAIKLGSTAIGLKTKEGVVLAVEKRITSPLLNHRFSYGEPMTVESTTQALCDLALRFGEGEEESMSRPFGVSLLIAGHDENGPSLGLVFKDKKNVTVGFLMPKRSNFLNTCTMLQLLDLASQSHDSSGFGVGGGVHRRRPFHAAGMMLPLPTPLAREIEIDICMKCDLNYANSYTRVQKSKPM